MPSHDVFSHLCTSEAIFPQSLAWEFRRRLVPIPCERAGVFYHGRAVGILMKWQDKGWWPAGCKKDFNRPGEDPSR